MIMNQRTFSLEQIKTAHAKVKSGADFPQYIRDIRGLGVLSYSTYVEDGHSDFKGESEFQISSPAKYDRLEIAYTADIEGFRNGLRQHQEGRTDYSTFCRLSAAAGIEKWIVSLKEMSCTYFDKADNEVLVEQIPQ